MGILVKSFMDILLQMTGGNKKKAMEETRDEDRMDKHKIRQTPVKTRILALRQRTLLKERYCREI